MDKRSVTYALEGGAERKVSYRGRCKACWGSLVGRGEVGHPITGIRCRACERIVAGEGAEAEEERMWKEMMFNLLNGDLGREAEYGDGPFAFKSFPHMDRLTEDEFENRVASARHNNAQKIGGNPLTRRSFPAGSVGWLFLEAKILMSAIAHDPTPQARIVPDFPGFDVREDGALAVRISTEGLSRDPDHHRQRTMKVMGANMMEAMISAFACELAMKAICLTTKDEALKAHDLLALFNDLPEASIRRIKADYPGIDDLMEEERQRFESWRYFEKSAEGKGMIAMINPVRAQALAKAARVILDEAEILGLNGRISMEAKQNVQSTGSERDYNHEITATVRGTEWPPRT